MRIGITCYPTHGGSGVVATELGKHLAERGHEVAFISYSTPLRLTTIPPRVSFHEVEIVEYPLLQNFPYCLALAAKMVDVAAPAALSSYTSTTPYPSPLPPSWPALAPPSSTEGGHHPAMAPSVTLVGNNPSFRPNHCLDHPELGRRHGRVAFLAEETYRQFAIKKEWRSSTTH